MSSAQAHPGQAGRWRCNQMCIRDRLLRTSSAMGRYTPQTPCAPRAAKHPLRVCSAPRSLKYPRRKEVPPIDFCHIPVSIIKRSAGRSAVAAAAYRSGTKLTNEWDGLTHDYTRKGGVVHAEIMLPAHAPPEFADRSIPVSYTHLDVYKRQGLHLERLIPYQPGEDRRYPRSH